MKVKQPSLAIHPDLLEAQQRAYEPCGFTSHSFSKETESKEYGAFDFEMNGRHVKFRVGKITPTKIGQFVTLWKRIGKGPILPYDMADPVDLFDKKTSSWMGSRLQVTLAESQIVYYVFSPMTRYLPKSSRATIRVDLS